MSNASRGDQMSTYPGERPAPRQPRVVLARWRAYVRDQSRFLVLAAPDLAGSLTLVPNGCAWHLTIAGSWA